MRPPPDPQPSAPSALGPGACSFLLDFGLKMARSSLAVTEERGPVFCEESSLVSRTVTAPGPHKGHPPPVPARRARLPHISASPHTCPRQVGREDGESPHRLVTQFRLPGCHGREREGWGGGLSVTLNAAAQGNARHFGSRVTGHHQSHGLTLGHANPPAKWRGADVGEESCTPSPPCSPPLVQSPWV